jgi:hypothetical protein
MTEIAIYTALAIWLFWHGYIHAMGLYRAKLKGRLVGLPLILSIPVIVFTFALDVVIQFTIASLVFWQWPKGIKFEKRAWHEFTYPWPVGDWFVTHRLRRYIKEGEGWRFKVASVICYRLTDPFDPTGAHCDDETPALEGGQ